MTTTIFHPCINKSKIKYVNGAKDKKHILNVLFLATTGQISGIQLQHFSTFQSNTAVPNV